MIKRKITTFSKLINYAIKANTCVRKAELLNAEETTELVCDNRISLVRWGDGEFNILNGVSVSYQPWSRELQRGLEDVLEEYLQNKADYLLCMPGEFLKPKSTDLKMKHLKSWAFSRYCFKMLFAHLRNLVPLRDFTR